VTIDEHSALVAGLRTAFAAEAMAAQRLTYFARIADIEGHPEIAVLFDEMAESIACAAHGHVDWLEDPVGTERNLSAALASEHREAAELYPALAEAARADGLDEVASWFETLRALKAAHVDRLERALEDLVARQPGGARP
jgi:rubrerythrin